MAIKYELKQGVILDGAKEVTIKGMNLAALVYLFHGHTMTITAVMDGKHMPGSFHKKGLAFDTRIRDLPENIMMDIFRDCNECFDPAWDIILEKDHLHFEYDTRNFRYRNHVSEGVD